MLNYRWGFGGLLDTLVRAWDRFLCLLAHLTGAAISLVMAADKVRVEYDPASAIAEFSRGSTGLVLRKGPTGSRHGRVCSGCGSTLVDRLPLNASTPRKLGLRGAREGVGVWAVIPQPSLTKGLFPFLSPARLTRSSGGHCLPYRVRVSQWLSSSCQRPVLNHHSIVVCRWRC